MQFFPHFLLRDLFGWILALGVLAALAALFPWELGEKADPFAPAYPDIRPEWYFMFMFQTLKLVPGRRDPGIEYEAIPILCFGLGRRCCWCWCRSSTGAWRATGAAPAFTRARRARPRLHGGHDRVGLPLAGRRSTSCWRPARRAGRASGLGTRAGDEGGAGHEARCASLALLAAAPGASSGTAPRRRAAPPTSCIACHSDAELFGATAMRAVRQFADGTSTPRSGSPATTATAATPIPALADDGRRAMDEAVRRTPSAAPRSARTSRASAAAATPTPST